MVRAWHKRAYMQGFNRWMVGVAMLAVSACGGADGVGDEPLDGENDPFARGKADGGIEPDSPEAQAVLALVNDPEVDLHTLDVDAALNVRAATGIIERRDGPDGLAGTEDDAPFLGLDELDAVPYVGPYALEQLLEYAIANGYLDPRAADRSIEVIFSPQPSEATHNAEVAERIGQAQHSIDVAMYSFSNAEVRNALADAVERGVTVRVIYETANDDRKLEGDALLESRSGELEQLGMDVRYVNKIMHHKLVIVDGPRDELDRAQTATVASGSANWSNSAGTRYDENTVFFTGYPEMTLLLQREFNHLWEHSRSFEAVPYEHVLSTLEITDELIGDLPDRHVYFTSDNFDISGDDTFKVTGRNQVGDQLVEAIEGATESIWIASGHLRLRSVAEALMAKKAAQPDLDIRVYLDGQEYISSSYHEEQLAELDECLAEASTEAQLRNCTDKGFLFGYAVGEAGIDVRYKYYAFRWHYTYAEQMHHKYLIIDGDELWTGSFNLSDNALHNTMENIMVFRGDQFADLVDAYEANFLGIWETGEGLLPQLLDEVATSDVVPLVFDSMALSWSEVTELKAALADACPEVYSFEFRLRPQSHTVCFVD